MGENLKRCRYCPEKRGMKVSKLRGRGKVMNVDGLHTYLDSTIQNKAGRVGVLRMSGAISGRRIPARVKGKFY